MAAGLSLFVAIIPVGCGRVQPLDERVDAASMNRLHRWEKRYVIPLGEPIESEYAEAVAIITHHTPDFRAPVTAADFDSSDNALCRRLHGARLRDVLVEGYDLTNDAIRQKIYLDQRSLNIVRLRMSETDAQLENQVAWYERAIQQRQDLLRRNEARRRELQDDAP